MSGCGCGVCYTKGDGGWKKESCALRRAEFGFTVDAVGGLADHLQATAAEGGLDSIRVGHPQDAAWQYRRQAEARRLFRDLSDRADVAALAHRIGVDVGRVMDVAADSSNAEAFAIRLTPGAPGGERLIGLAEAEQALADLLSRDLELAA